MIQVSQLAKIYNTGEHPVVALTDVNLEVKAGEFVSVMGPSGSSGKSTLMNLLGCLDTPTSGSYKLDGKIAYRIYEEDDKLVVVILAGTRENFYNELKRYMK